MGIDSESDVAATLVIGPTTEGMVRIYIESEGHEIPMDFDPDEALEIAEELRAAAEAARGSRRGSGSGARSTGDGGSRSSGGGGAGGSRPSGGGAGRSRRSGRDGR